MDATSHCKHGTYVGTPGGPDHLCGDCEDGRPAPRRFTLTLTVEVEVVDPTDTSDQHLVDWFVDLVRDSVEAADYWLGPDSVAVSADVVGHHLQQPTT